MSLFHKEVGFPATLTLPSGKFPVTFSEHAQQQCIMDINGAIRPISNIILDPYRIFEVETNDSGTIVKFAYRTRYNQKCDVIYVFVFHGEALFTKTVWLNRRSDKHRTLDVSKYATP